MSLLADVLQRGDLLRQLRARDMHQGRLVSLREPDPQLPRQAPRHVRYQNSLGMDQSRHVHSHDNVHPPHPRIGARLGILPSHRAVHSHHWYILFVVGENIFRALAYCVDSVEIGEARGNGDVVLRILGEVDHDSHRSPSGACVDVE